MHHSLHLNHESRSKFVLFAWNCWLDIDLERLTMQVLRCESLITDPLPWIDSEVLLCQIFVTANHGYRRRLSAPRASPRSTFPLDPYPERATTLFPWDLYSHSKQDCASPAEIDSYDIFGVQYILIRSLIDHRADHLLHCLVGVRILKTQKTAKRVQPTRTWSIVIILDDGSPSHELRTPVEVVDPLEVCRDGHHTRLPRLRSEYLL